MTGPFEHHISADIAIAAWDYYCMSRDMRWLREEGYPLMEKVAEFLSSRVEQNEDGSYSICNVVCADEYAEGSMIMHLPMRLRCALCKMLPKRQFFVV